MKKSIHSSLLLAVGCAGCLAVSARAQQTPDPAAEPPVKSAVSVVTNALEFRRAFREPAPGLESFTEYGRASETLYLEKTPLLDQRAVQSAAVKKDSNGRTVIDLVMTEAGKQSFAEITKKLVGEQMAIVVDGKLISAPKILEPIYGGQAQIVGSFSAEEAKVMAAKISSAAPKPVAAQPAEITFSGATTSPISSAVAVPEGRAWFLTSGTVPPVADEKAPEGSRERYGDTKTQGIGALRQIEAQLTKAGLGLKDVVYLRVYVAADKAKGGQFDFQGWFDAYGQFFGTKDNPIKPARSTVGVAVLVKPEWLVEIEAVGIYPARTTTATPGAEDAAGEKKSAAKAD